MKQILNKLSQLEKQENRNLWLYIEASENWQIRQMGGTVLKSGKNIQELEQFLINKLKINYEPSI